VGNGENHWSVFDWLTEFLVEAIPSGLILIILSFTLLFGSILLFRKIISDLLKARSPEAFSRFFFKSQVKSFSWGVITTAAIRSSTITTSVVVPIVAKRIATLQQAAPFIMGANIGTTITGFLAVTMSNSSADALSLAMAHFLFNGIGVLLFFPLPALRQIPIRLADSLGKLTLKYRLAGFLFLLVTFFFLPFVLIYFNQDSFKNVDAVYERTEGGKKTYYRISSRLNLRTSSGEWKIYDGKDDPGSKPPRLIYPISIKDKALFVGKDMYLFSKPGFCWDGEDTKGKYAACVEKTLSHFTVSGMSFDSVYKVRLKYQHANDSAAEEHIYLSAVHKMILVRDISVRDSIVHLEQVISLQEK
jgi:sodium-dependent phosphate cotransporter